MDGGPSIYRMTEVELEEEIKHMMRSMFSGVAGLKAHQTKMDVVGNNIANVNTVGYKRSTVTFNEMLNQQLRGASAPSASFFGGTNPMQIGLGVTVGAIDVVHSAGSPQSTGRSMDMSIEGDGYFVIGLGADNYYTRAGNFGFDAENNLVASNGMKVKGWTSAVGSDNKFSLDTSQAISPINLTALSTSQIMQATSSVELGINLDSRLPANAGTKTYGSPTVTGDNINDKAQHPIKINIGEGVVVDGDFAITDESGKSIPLNASNAAYWDLDPSSGVLIIKGTLEELADHDSVDITGWDASEKIQVNYKKADYQTSMKVYDNQGGAHDFTVSYMKTDSNEWVSNYAIDGDVIDFGGSFTKTMNFKTNGQMDNNIPQNAEFELPYTFANPGLDPLNIKIDLTNMIQVANENSTLSNIQNGFSPGSLQRISVNQTGQIIGTFSNGENIELAQVALATFSNTSGLGKMGDTLFIESRNSGLPEFGAPGTAGKGSVKPEALEMSNVDLSQEFVDMIITQRGFQANSRIITTSDEMLQELVNLKR